LNELKEENPEMYQWLTCGINPLHIKSGSTVHGSVGLNQKSGIITILK